MGEKMTFFKLKSNNVSFHETLVGNCCLVYIYSKKIQVYNLICFENYSSCKPFFSKFFNLNQTVL